MLVLPGGLGGVEAIQKNQFALALIQKAYDRGCWLCAICAAPTILAREGCLDRRKAVCYPGMEDEMGSAVVQKGAQVVTDGRIITGEAAGSAFEFGLRLVEAACGPGGHGAGAQCRPLPSLRKRRRFAGWCAPGCPP